MRRKNKEFELDLEEYIDEDYDENFYNENNSKTLSAEEEEYNNFFTVDDDYDTDYVDNTEDEDSYAEFIKVQDAQIEEDNSNDDDDDNDEDEDDEDGSSYYTYDSDNGIYKFLSMFLVIFKWIGVAIAIILIAYFITQGNMKSLLMYIIGLVFAAAPPEGSLQKE